MRKEYRLTNEELKDLLDVKFSGRQYEAFWQRLAEKRGFLWETVMPAKKGYKYFTAVEA